MAERTTPGDAASERDFKAATSEAREADAVEPRAIAACYDRKTGRVLAELPQLVRSLPRLEASDAEAFDRDLRLARESLSARPLNDPWES